MLHEDDPGTRTLNSKVHQLAARVTLFSHHAFIVCNIFQVTQLQKFEFSRVVNSHTAASSEAPEFMREGGFMTQFQVQPLTLMFVIHERVNDQSIELRSFGFELIKINGLSSAYVHPFEMLHVREVLHVSEMAHVDVFGTDAVTNEPVEAELFHTSSRSEILNQ